MENSICRNCWWYLYKLLNVFAWIAKSKELKGSEGVIGEDGGPAEEEDCHDQDQHVDHLEKKVLKGGLKKEIHF